MLSDVCVLKAPRNWYLEKFNVSCSPVACFISFQHSILGIKTLKQFISRYIISLVFIFNSALKKALILKIWNQIKRHTILLRNFFFDFYKMLN